MMQDFIVYNFCDSAMFKKKMSEGAFFAGFNDKKVLLGQRDIRRVAGLDYFCLHGQALAVQTGFRKRISMLFIFILTTV